ncbi:Transferase [Corchorus olitorius]|uniref:Transferase n=1 Tax=Corchorus olitorius TaxID=93759 RepID=A0A1R3I4X5_9ROSI|nr:Transferase [Corchorus olitorius]
MAHKETVEFLYSIHVSPPPASVPTTSLPLTFFDLPWFFIGTVERLFFYEFPHPTSYFMKTTLPTLKRSLSLALQYFFPYAANIMCPQQPGKPYIHYTDGDFVTLTVAEFAADFNHVVANHPRDIKLLHPFVPQLPPSRVAEDGSRVLPILAIQITVFPNSGVCIGTTYNHVVGDGKSFMHFMKSWASLNKSGRSDLTHSPPLLNRDVIKVSDELELAYMRLYWHWVSCFNENENLGPSHYGTVEDKVRATFVLGQAHAERLKQLVSAQCIETELGQLHISTYVVICAFVWVCLIKSKENSSSHNDDGGDDDDDKFHTFVFPFDGRNRLEFPVPTTYFGNCLKACIVDVKISEIRGKNGIGLAAKAIRNKIKQEESCGLQGAEHWMSNYSERQKTGRVTGVAGSPKLHVYEVDFGWGRPCKVELTHIDREPAISLAECRDEQRGIEVGLALKKNHMDDFITVFEQTMNLL